MLDAARMTYSWTGPDYISCSESLAILIPHTTNETNKDPAVRLVFAERERVKEVPLYTSLLSLALSDSLPQVRFGAR